MLASTAFNHGKRQDCTKVNPPRSKYFAPGGKESLVEVGLFNDSRISSCCWTRVSVPLVALCGLPSVTECLPVWHEVWQQQ